MLIVINIFIVIKRDDDTKVILVFEEEEEHCCRRICTLSTNEHGVQMWKEDESTRWLVLYIILNPRGSLAVLNSVSLHKY